MADRLLNHENLKKLSNEKVFEVLCKLYPNHELFNISLGWRESKEYILKAKGGQGDVIIGWI